MTQYHKYLKDWTSERGITSFLGSDKPAFQQDWKEEKRAGVRFGEEMGREDINRAGEPFKKPKPKAKVPIKKATISGEQKKYDIIKKLFAELDREDERKGNDTDPFGFVKDFIIIPEREGKTKKKIVDKAYDYFKTNPNINYDIRRSVLMRKLFLELQELMEA